MAKEKIKAALNELTEDQFKRLKSDLNDFSKEEESRENIRKIPLSVLEKINTPYDLADLLEQHYPSRAVKVVVLLLRKVPSNEEAEKLEKWYKGTGSAGLNETSISERKTKRAKTGIDVSGPNLDCYDMKKKRVAFMMCVTKNRRGADKDIETMKKMFETFLFKTPVGECIDPSKDKLMDKLKDFREKINNPSEEISCCLITLMCHGMGNKYILDKDGCKISLEEIFSLFNNKECPKLQQKPKIFIIQACQGTNKDYGVQADDKPVEPDEVTKLKLPTASDYFIVYSSQQGFISVRCTDTGSPMITIMDEVFTEHGMQWHVGDLFTKVNSEITQREFKMKNEKDAVKVTIVMESTLTKAIYLAPN